MHGQFVWYELTTPDTDAARRFYPIFTGWGTQPFGADYTVWTSAGAPFAGLFRLTSEQRQQGIPPNWMPYVEANNVDETGALATSLGGTVLHGPEDIPGTGRFAVVQDPQGAVFGIYKPTRPSQSWNGTPVIGRFSWHELMTTDYSKAFDFYRRLFGWEKTSEMDMGGGNKYFMYGKGKPFGGIFNRTAEMASMRPFWMCYIHVKDVDKAVAQATQAGARLHRGPMPVPGGSIAILGDPQGAAFALHHLDTAAAAPVARKSAKKAGAKKKQAAKRSASKRPVAKKQPTKKRAARKAGTKRRATKAGGRKSAQRKVRGSKRRRR